MLDLDKLNEFKTDGLKLKYIYRLIDHLGYINKVNEIDLILYNLNVEDHDPSILIGILTISHVWKNRLSNYNDFYLKVENKLKIIYPNDYKTILLGLE